MSNDFLFLVAQRKIKLCLPPRATDDQGGYTLSPASRFVAAALRSDSAANS